MGKGETCTPGLVVGQGAGGDKGDKGDKGDFNAYTLQPFIGKS
ncbi:MAG: hypothetical protein ACRAVC_08420 [Trichormus sp.]